MNLFDVFHTAKTDGRISFKTLRNAKQVLPLCSSAAMLHIRSHKKGDIFNVDIPGHKWYSLEVKRKKITAVYIAVPSK